MLGGVGQGSFIAKNLLRGGHKLGPALDLAASHNSRLRSLQLLQHCRQGGSRVEVRCHKLARGLVTFEWMDLEVMGGLVH